MASVYAFGVQSEMQLEVHVHTQTHTHRKGKRCRNIQSTHLDIYAHTGTYTLYYIGPLWNLLN